MSTTIIIRTRYEGPTASRGSRIIARGAGRSLRLPYPHGSTRPHEDAALALAKRLGYASIAFAGEAARASDGQTWRVVGSKV